MSATIFFSRGMSRDEPLGRSIIARALWSPKIQRSTLRTNGSAFLLVLAALDPWIAVAPPASARISAYRLCVCGGSVLRMVFCGLRTSAWYGALARHRYRFA